MKLGVTPRLQRNVPKSVLIGAKLLAGSISDKTIIILVIRGEGVMSVVMSKYKNIHEDVCYQHNHNL